MPPFNGFYFDCDSTLSTIEGVDELTRKLGPALRAELHALTEQAMEGARPLADVYVDRLGALAPTRAELDVVGGFYIDNLVPDAAATIAALQALGKQVGIISGGLRQPVSILATHLGIPDAHVHAVPLLFDQRGAYRDFDRSSPLWRNLGKVEVLRRLPASHRPVLFMGDGVTDLEAAAVVDLFVGFGGVKRRARVAAEAAVYLTDPSLAGVLRVGLTETEKNTLRDDPRFGHLGPMLYEGPR
jgi:phosphoserine phosphatase